MAKVKVTYRIDPDLNDDLSYVALLLKRKKNDLATEGIRKYLDELIKTEKLEDKIKTLRG